MFKATLEKSLRPNLAEVLAGMTIEQAFGGHQGLYCPLFDQLLDLHVLFDGCTVRIMAIYKLDYMIVALL